MDNKFSVKQSLYSGQCFRFVPTNNNSEWIVYSGIDKNVKSIKLTENFTNYDNFWNNYFDLDFDYESVRKKLSSVSDVMKKAIEYASGIHILNQDPWEAICSFVISQNNNIKRIKKIIDSLCNIYGEQNSAGIHGFPAPEKLAYLTEDELKETGLGFRAPYIINVSMAVLQNIIDFKFLKNAPIQSALNMLMSVKGIGPKVANCSLLFGFHRLDCFPIDTWIKKVMNTYFPNTKSDIFGEYAGIAQQYLFHWIRRGEI